ncbi:ABC transporter permease [Candidatus Amarobacter glycogenicus]|uniref:ABC transporter permease n=1 Tax=Candidatus Amarobacter glycogenicus TaxID=3140699 RepID=UPI002A17DB43|nr:ABC transporter permease [Dehalococcoidia bacterium]
MAQDPSADIQTRLLEGSDLTVRAADGSREFSKNTSLVSSSLHCRLLFHFVVMGSSGYLVQVVTDEKENRTIEIMMTTVSPGQLIGGKALGLLAVSLTQAFIWVATGIVASRLAQFFETLRFVSVPWSLLLVAVLFFIPAYAFIAGLMTAIGSAVTELTQAQQIVGILNLLFPDALFLYGPVFCQSLQPGIWWFRLSSLRLRFYHGDDAVGHEQYACVANGVELVVVGSALGSVWWRPGCSDTGMLRYGQSLKLKDVATAVRPPQRVWFSGSLSAH